MSHATVADNDVTEGHRTMRAIPKQHLHLTCHRADIDPHLAAVLDAARPNDRARGYSAGDVRGAFTLVEPR